MTALIKPAHAGFIADEDEARDKHQRVADMLVARRRRKRDRILKNLETAATWNADEVAAYVGCHVATVWRKVQSGDLPKPIKIVGRTVWRRAEIEALIEGAK